MGINEKKLIGDICDQRIDSSDITNQKWRRIAEIVSKSKYCKSDSTQSFKDFLLSIYRKADLLDQTIQIDNAAYDYMRGLIKIFDRRGQWLRNPKYWKPVSHNSRRQFGHLLRYLFARYDLPVFMDYVWLRNDKGSYRYRDWYIHLALGYNLRHAKSKIKITKKIAHYFGTAPDHYSVDKSLWWGIVMSMGGNERLAREFLSARPADITENQEFWKSFIKFLIDNPMIDRRQISPLVDFINVQKFNPVEIFEDGRIKQLPPPQPNFSLRNRNPNTLLNLVGRWHRSLKKINNQELIVFKESEFRGYSSAKSKEHEQYWKIFQLRTNFELIKEGGELGHCVASYVPSCTRGSTSIWSLTQMTGKTEKKVLTIEVNNSGVIVECRGRFNRYPTKGEFDIVRFWAKREGLGVSGWIEVEQ